MLSRYRDSIRHWTDPVGHALFRLRLRPNHLTLAGLGVSLLAATAFVAGRTRVAGGLLLLAGLFDFFDGSLARASGQVTPFGAFLDSVIDRYSDIVVLLGIVVLFARTPHARGAVVAMAGLVGSVMVSYTKARAESIGIECNVGMMERPERMICLIAGAVFDLLEPALWVLAILANLTALQRIAYTRRAMRDAALVCALTATVLGLAVATGTASDGMVVPGAGAPPTVAPATIVTPAVPLDSAAPSGVAATPGASPAPRGPGVPASPSTSGAPSVSGDPAVPGSAAASGETPASSDLVAPGSPAASIVPSASSDAVVPGSPAASTAPSASSDRVAPVGPAASDAPSASSDPVAPGSQSISGEPAIPIEPVSARGPAAGATSPSAAQEKAWAQAVAEFQQGRVDAAIREFGHEALLKGPIGDYLGVLLADAHARRGNMAAARASALGVADRHPTSRLTPPALITAATLASHAGDEAGAQAALKRLIASYPDSPEIPQALYLLGMTGEARGQLEAAALAYRELTVIAPASGWADGAGDRLAALRSAGVPTPELSERQRVDRAERLLRSGVPKTASDEAERIAEQAQDPGIILRALRVVADASQRLGRYELAARALDLAARRAPADRQAGLRLEQARLLLRAGQRQQALTILTALDKTPTEGEAAEAALLRARTLDEMDRHADAQAAYRAVAAKYPNREVAGSALWRLGWLAYLRNDVRGAEQAWLKGADVPGGRAYRQATLYWAGRAKEQTAGKEPAARLYSRVLREAPRSYYGLLAAHRTAAASSEPGGREPAIRLPADPQDAIANDPGFARADLLRRIGLVEFALRELEEVVLASVGDPVRLYGFSSAYVRDERYDLALRILRRHFVPLATTGHPTIPRAFWEMLYPFAWRGEVTEAAGRAGLDPFLVAAVVREESSYSPKAVSRAGARGLMQLMPGTAQPMAELRGWPFRDGELLDEPALNIQLGSAFLAGLLQEFGDPRLAVAAYNAGPRRVREWWKARRTNDIEAFVEQIPFDETRQYVKRVMLSWEEYRRIYGGAPPAR